MGTPTVTNLVAGITARVSSSRLIQMTNFGAPAATTVDTTKLTQAAVDAALFFEMTSMKDYDDANVGYVHLCWPGVLAFLYEYEGQRSPNSNETMEAFKTRCETMRNQKRIRFTSSSVLTNTTPTARDPYWDESDFDGMRPS